jgi:hypothetical protein
MSYGFTILRHQRRGVASIDGRDALFGLTIRYKPGRPE